MIEKADNLNRIAIVAVIYKISNNDTFLLFIKRRERRGDPWSGDIAFPGGRKKEGEDYIETIYRETKEETGLDLSKHAKLVGAGPETTSLLYTDLIIKSFLFKLTNKNVKFNVPNKEVSDIFWIPINELVLSRCKRFSNIVNDYVYVICYRWKRKKDVVIWGLTYRILYKLLRNFKFY